MPVENVVEKIEVPAVVKRPSKLCIDKSIPGMLFYILNWSKYDHEQLKSVQLY